MSEITQQLARFIVSSRWSDIPSAVRHEGERAVLDWLGCALEQLTVQCWSLQQLADAGTLACASVAAAPRMAEH